MNCLPHILILALHSQPGFNTVVPGAGAFYRHDASGTGTAQQAAGSTAIGTKQTLGNDYGNMSLQISGSNLQVQNGAGAAAAGTYNISIDIFAL